MEITTSAFPNIDKICETLHEKYGSPEHGNKSDPLDELVYIILSTRTRQAAFELAYERVKARFPTWAEVSLSTEPELASILQPFGLANLKARQIVSILDRLREMTGHASLDMLYQKSDADAESFLISLPGVSKKVAKCVLMYSLRRLVLPVDIHTYRVATRIGIPGKRRADTSQDMIEGAIPAKFRYAFHVNAVALGRDVCLPGVPRCERCCIATWCEYFKESRKVE